MTKKYVKVHSAGQNHAVEYNDGEQTEWLRFPSRQTAEAAGKAIQWKLDRKEPITVADFLDLWVELHVLPQVKAAGASYLRAVTAAKEFFGPARLLDEVSVEDIKAFISDKRAAGTTDRRITPTLNVWSSAFATATRWRLMDGNPVSQIDGLLLGVSGAK